MELDPEVKGDGNSYTTEFRQYDPRLGRWLSLDPLMQKFPSVSPYVAFANNPIWYSDPYGLAPTGGDKKGGESSTGKKSSGPGIWQVLKNISTKTVSTLKSLKQAVTRTGYKLFPMHKELEEFVVTPSKNPPVEEAGCPVLIPGPYVAPPTPAPLTVIAGGAAEEVAVGVGSSALKFLGLTLSFLLYSEEGYNPESGMNPQQQPVPDYVNEPKKDDEGYITLYRGVSEEAHPTMWKMAQKGVAVPKGLLSPNNLHDDIDDHTMGDNYTLYTSWSSDKSSALTFAKGFYGNKKGVVLTLRVKLSETLVSNLSTIMQESEYLLWGVQTTPLIEKVP